jgi:hypothetical protein
MAAYLLASGSLEMHFVSFGCVRFAHIARNAILQHQVLLALKKHPALQRKVLMELAKKSATSKQAVTDCRRLTVEQCSLPLTARDLKPLLYYFLNQGPDPGDIFDQIIRDSVPSL